MAREAALAFFDKVRTDPTLRWRLMSLSRRNVTILLRFAADAGYFFSQRDYQAALEIELEMTEDVRRAVAEGWWIIPGLTYSDPSAPAAPAVR